MMIGLGHFLVLWVASAKTIGLAPRTLRLAVSGAWARQQNGYRRQFAGSASTIWITLTIAIGLGLRQRPTPALPHDACNRHA
jgi:hypothetical protein